MVGKSEKRTRETDIKSQRCVQTVESNAEAADQDDEPNDEPNDESPCGAA